MVTPKLFKYEPFNVYVWERSQSSTYQLMGWSLCVYMRRLQYTFQNCILLAWFTICFFSLGISQLFRAFYINGLSLSSTLGRFLRVKHFPSKILYAIGDTVRSLISWIFEIADWKELYWKIVPFRPYWWKSNKIFVVLRILKNNYLSCSYNTTKKEDHFDFKEKHRAP